MVVFILLLGLIFFYKKNLEFIIEYVVDFDKCRYVMRYEVVWYYIDIDYWDMYLFKKVLCDWIEVLIKYIFLYLVNVIGDIMVFMFDFLFGKG